LNEDKTPHLDSLSTEELKKLYNSLQEDLAEDSAIGEDVTSHKEAIEVVRGHLKRRAAERDELNRQWQHEENQRLLRLTRSFESEDE